MPIPAPSTPGYSQITQAQALTALAGRLGDQANVYWAQAELRLYLAEALRTWQAYTGWYKDRAVVPLQPNVNWYDLAASLSPPILADTITDQNLTTTILYHLLERQLVAGAWVGTDQFTLAQVQNALQNRLNRFIGDTGLTTSVVVQQSGTSPPIGRALIPSGTIDIRRVAWVNLAGVKTYLWKVSEWELNSFTPGWAQTTNDPPQVYSAAISPPNTIQLAPAPAANGQLEMLLVQQGPTLNLATTTTILNVSDDYTWGIKFGALADLLSGDGQAKDQDRAQYCEQRYQEAVELAKTFPAVMDILVNGVPVFVGSAYDLDTFTPGWENATPGTPINAGMGGRRILAVSPAPAVAMQIGIDVVRNIPIPATDSAFVQIPPDVVPALLDYAQHLASFKMGGQEFMNTDLQRKNLLIEAGNYNGRLRQLNFYNDATRSPSLTMSAELPRLDTPLLVT